MRLRGGRRRVSGGSSKCDVKPLECLKVSIGVCVEREKGRKGEKEIAFDLHVEDHLWQWHRKQIARIKNRNEKSEDRIVVVQ